MSRLSIFSIKGREVEALYSHLDPDLPHVGDSYVMGAGDNQAPMIVMQVIGFATFNAGGLAEKALLEKLEEQYVSVSRIVPQLCIDDLDLPTSDAIGIVHLEIRRIIEENGEWNVWDGMIPSRQAQCSRIPDEELIKQCNLSGGIYPIRAGSLRLGTQVALEGRNYEKLNIMVGVKGSGKSHLCKIVILDLIQHQRTCLVMDVNREYVGLPELTDECAGIIVLVPGENFFIGLEEYGWVRLVRLMNGMDVQQNTLSQFESDLRQLFRTRAEARARGQQIPFMTIDVLLQTQWGGGNYVVSAIQSRLERMQNLEIFASTAAQASSLRGALERCRRKGGCLALDLYAQSDTGRTIISSVTLDFLENYCRTQWDDPRNLPFVFLDESQLYVPENILIRLATRVRHHGMTITLITNEPQTIRETILRQADNLFILRLTHDEDIRYIAKASKTGGIKTVSAFAQILPNREVLIVGECTRDYPVICNVAARDDVMMSGETRYSF